MASPARRLLTVFGATGNQGGSVIQKFLQHPRLKTQFSLRAVTRNADSDKAKALAAKGVEVVEADLNDAKTVNTAVAGSSVVFGLTNFWDPTTRDQETAQGKAIADACRENKVDLFIWSSLPGKAQIDATGPAGTNITAVPHFDTKAAVEAYVTNELKGKLDATFIHPAFFLENMLAPPMGVSKNSDGSGEGYTLSLPVKPDTANIPLYTPSDMGTYVAALLLAPKEEVINKQWFATSQVVSGNQLAESLSKATGKKVEFKQVVLDEWAASNLPEFIRDELAANLALVSNPGYFGSEKAARDGEKAIRDLIAQTHAGELTDTVDFYRDRLTLQ